MGFGICLGRRAVVAGAGTEAVARCARLGLRSASRLLDARARGAQPLADLPRVSCPACRICPADGLHARRVVADHGTSVLRFVGLSTDGLFCADSPLWNAAGFHVHGGPAAPTGYRSYPGLGALSLPEGSPCVIDVRWHRSLQSSRSAPWLSSGLEERGL